MAIKGLSKVIIAKDYAFNDTQGKVFYNGDPVATDKPISYSAEITSEESEGLYADNGLAEKSPAVFTDGTITLGTDELTNETSKALYSVKETTLTVDGKEVSGLVYDDTVKGKTVGLALIEEHQKNNKDFYRAVIFPKVSFSIPSTSAETRGPSISWQTPEISGSLMKSDEANAEVMNPWKLTFDCPTELEAIATINGYFADHKATATAGE